MIRWESFWDVASPEAVALTMIEIYGAAAFLSASNCAATAIADGRNEDCRFWTTVRSCIEATQLRNRERAVAYWEAIGLHSI
ncbi:MAG: hypothetical protein GY807_16890 [Gammaproteobacteria bacterium]|nr:hypothetical protein [Gammaproteobacteria bacterium]